mmetsp:Transcript_3148/g.4666  ORF Transcript_3148/g.4666 Transcript_3148/m.4666 type:complete len:648 (-) Transcript_3148:413-2356(-)
MNIMTLDDHSIASSLTGTSSISHFEVPLTVCDEGGNDSKFRSVHRISLSALSHNYYNVAAVASNQRCDVICVVKADGYGHGAIDTAIHLADNVGANAFAVATLEEAVELRKALEASSHNESLHQKLNGGQRKELLNAFVPPASTPPFEQPLSKRRDSFIRILVLGPPVGFPRCFHDYYHYQIECMISGPEVADALKVWISNPLDIQRRLVERVSQATKEEFSSTFSGQPEKEKMFDNASTAGTLATHSTTTTEFPQTRRKSPVPGSSINNKSATLNATSGDNLAKEFRQMLQTQQKVVAQEATLSSFSSAVDEAEEKETANPYKFEGIEAAALASVHRQEVETQQVLVESSDSDSISSTSSALMFSAGSNKRRLRWHAMVDTGMGRLGFKTDAPLDGTRRDSVDIIQELVKLQVHGAAPLEFYGMCTHMADANPTSTYTNAQTDRFKSLLKRVRNAGISVPTVSTDNSAALLTTTLTHFDPNKLLEQKSGLNTRGFVRCGGALYGQRPAFPQLQAVSTLCATVRHVAVLKEGESVGYDRAYIAPHDVRIATLAIGFADGYPRELGNGRGHVCIRESLFKVVGNVCMDMLMVELGPAYEYSEVRVGDTAILWGGSGVPLATVASSLGTTQSALTCGLDKTRVLREYVP